MDSEEEEVADILYDLNHLVEWSEEREESDIRNQLKHHPFAATSSWSQFISQRLKQWLGRPSNVSEVFERLHALRPEVIISASPNGNFLLLHKAGSRVELFNTSADFETPALCLSLPHAETYRQWLQVAWSPSSSHFAISGPTVGVLVFTVRGALVFSRGASSEEGKVEDAVVMALALIEPNSNLLLVSVSFSSLVIVTDVATSSASSFRLSDRCSGLRVLCGLAEPDSSILALGTTSIALGSLSPSTKHGLILLRSLNRAPFLQPAPVSEEDLVRLQMRNYLARLSQADASDAICQLSLSPDKRRVAALHTSGAVSLWSFPSAQLLAMRLLRDQVFHEALSPVLAEKVFSSWARRILPCLPSNRPTWVTWWDAGSLVVARENGSVTVWSSKFQSRMGERPQWFEPYVLVSQAALGGKEFFVVEHDSRRRKHKWTVEEEEGEMTAVDDGEEEEEEEEDEDGEEGFVMFALRRGGATLKRSIGWSGEGAELSSKRPRIAETNYRLLRFCSTTPEQLFQRKIEAEEYGEALGLCRRYPDRLDPDLVFQRQWQTSQMSRAAIEDFLTKISKHSWVLHECLERCPENIDSMRHLLELGLRATDVDALVNADSGRLVLTDAASLMGDGEYRERLLESLDLDKLSLRQTEILRQRRRLLAFIRQLDAYEEVLGGRHRAPDRYTASGFSEFRAKDPLAAAIKFARDGNLTGQEIMLGHFHRHLSPHTLLLLANIPETESPRGFDFLIPSGEEEEEAEEEDTERKDWSDSLPVEDPMAVGVEATARALYDEMPQYAKFRGVVTRELLGEWFAVRAREVERGSGQVSCAADLVRIGVEMGLGGLEELMDGLSLLETLVYECGAMQDVGLEQVKRLSKLEVVKMMMSRCQSPYFVRNVARFVLPFLQRCDGVKWRVLGQFLVERAEDKVSGLGEVRALLESEVLTLKRNEDVQTLTEIAVDCCYAWRGGAEATDVKTLVADAQAIHDSLIKAFADRQAVQATPQRVRELGRHLEGARTLSKLGQPHPPSYFRSEAADDPERVSGMLRGILAFKFHEHGAWKSSRELRPMLRELRSLLETALPCLHPSMLLRFLVESLLHTGVEGNIQVAAQFMDLENRQRVSRPRSNLEVGDLLSFEDSASCIADVARQLFNVSLGPSHESMTACRRCLDLLADSQHPQVARERRLVEAVDILHQLKVDLLPAEIRNCPDKTSLVSSLLRRRPQLYQRWEEVETLGVALAMAEGEGQSKVRVLCLLVDAALRENDAKIAEMLCNRMLRLSSAPVSAWPQFERTARHLPTDSASRRRLLHFSLAHCPAKEIGRLAAMARKLEDNKAAAAGDNANVDRSVNGPRCSPFISDAARSSLYSGLNGGRREEGPEVKQLRMAERGDDDLLSQAALEVVGEDGPLFAALAGLVEDTEKLEAVLKKAGQEESSLRMAVKVMEISLRVHGNSKKRKSLQKKCMEALTELCQRRRLLAVCPDLQLARFAVDEEYRRETLLGMCLTPSLSQYRLAIEVGVRYGVAEEALRRAHLEFLLTEGPLKEEERIREVAGSHVEEELAERIFRLVDGTDHARISLLLSLLAADSSLQGRRVDAHRQIMKKLKPAAPGLDYKAVTCRDADGARLLAVVERHLSSGNVHVFAKLSSQLGAGGELQPSDVFAAWIIRLFWRPLPDGGWKVRMEECAKLFPRLNAEGLVGFVRAAIFSPESSVLGAERRKEVVKSALQFCGTRSKTRGDDNWERAGDTLRDFLTHLDRLMQTLWPRLQEVGCTDLAQFALLPPGAAFMEEMLARLLVARVPPQEVAALAHEMGEDAEAQIGEGLRRAAQQTAVENIHDRERCQKRLEELFAACADVDGIGKPRGPLLAAVESLLAEPDLRARLGGFLVQQLQRWSEDKDSGAVATSIVGQALLVLGERFEIADTEVVEMQEVRKREERLRGLILGCDAVSGMRTIHEALAILRHLEEDAETTLWRVWVQRAAADFTTELGPFVVQELTKAADEGTQWAENDVTEARAAFEETAAHVALAVACLSPKETEAVERLLGRPEVIEVATGDVEMQRRLVKRGWMHLVAPTALYKHCVDLLLTEPTLGQIKEVARSLRHHGCSLEAAALVAESQELHPTLRTFNALAELWKRL